MSWVFRSIWITDCRPLKFHPSFLGIDAAFLYMFATVIYFINVTWSDLQLNSFRICFRIVVILTLLLLSLLVFILTALVGKGIYDAVKEHRRKNGKIRQSRLNNDNDFDDDDDAQRSRRISMNNIATVESAAPKNGGD